MKKLHIFKKAKKPLKISYLGGIMYLDKIEALENGLKIFNKLFKHNK